MIGAACIASSKVSDGERFDRLVDAELGHTSRLNKGLEGLVNHRRAPTCVETHVKTSRESMKSIFRLPLTAWTHAEQAHGDRSSALWVMWSD